MRVLGMSPWPEKLSDDQYIERIRKTVRMKRPWRYVQGAIAAGILVMTIWLLFMSIEFLSNLPVRISKGSHPVADQELVYSTFLLAGICGFVFGYFFYKAVFFIFEMFFGFRQAKLLVDCWDALSDAEKNHFRQRSS